MDRDTPLDRLTGWLQRAHLRLVEELSRLTVKTGLPKSAGGRSLLLVESVAFISDAVASARRKSGLLRRSFVIVVVLPAATFWLYSVFWQSERFVSETKMTVREAQRGDRARIADATAMVAKLAGGVASHEAQDAYMVLAYIKSRAVIEDLGGRAYFERAFSGRKADYFSRLSQGASLEDLWKYWLSHISASVENLSGILTLRLDAFSPEDARDIVKDVVRLSE